MISEHTEWSLVSVGGRNIRLYPITVRATDELLVRSIAFSALLLVRLLRSGVWTVSIV